MTPILKTDTLSKFIYVSLITIAYLTIINVGVLYIDFDLSDLFHTHIDSTSFFIEFAPEIWLTLMSIVLGTLIIVISIASQSNPKLIDYYISDYPSLFYTCGITLAGIENIYLQLNLSVDSLYWSNIVFINAYILLPLAIINAMPYAFYILSYTKTSSLIKTIYQKNLDTIIKQEKKASIPKPEKVQYVLLDTINQLDDQHGFVHFKEPKSQIIEALGKLVKYFLATKEQLSPEFFTITDTIKNDISFRTLSDKFDEIEEKKTFFEHKILRIYSGIYHQLVDQGHHDLASQCAHELSAIGVSAIKTKNPFISELVLMQFNTFLRVGIKHANQTKDIRHVYNCVFHYTQLILYFIETKQYESVVKSCQHLTYYGKEVYKLSLDEQHFVFLIDCFASEVQKILMALSNADASKKLQLRILKIYANLEPEIHDRSHLKRVRHDTSRSIKIGLILFYLEKKESEFVHQLIQDIQDDLRYFNQAEILRIVKKDCSFLISNQSTFWEYTDRGDKNIYFSPHKNQLSTFLYTFTNCVNLKEESVEGPKSAA